MLCIVIRQNKCLYYIYVCHLTGNNSARGVQVSKILPEVFKFPPRRSASYARAFECNRFCLRVPLYHSHSYLTCLSSSALSQTVKSLDFTLPEGSEPYSVVVTLHQMCHLKMQAGRPCLLVCNSVSLPGFQQWFNIEAW